MSISVSLSSVQTVSDVGESELGKRGSDIAQKTVGKMADQADELRKTDVGQAVQKGATVVKEELLDDIIKHSAPYKPPGEADSFVCVCVCVTVCG